MFPQTFSPALPVSPWETDPRCEVTSEGSRGNTQVLGFGPAPHFLAGTGLQSRAAAGQVPGLPFWVLLLGLGLELHLDPCFPGARSTSSLWGNIKLLFHYQVSEMSKFANPQESLL